MLLRKNTISLVYLHEIFHIPNAIREPWNAIVVVVESEGGELIGLVVDELHKQQQVVIKGLEDNYDPIPGISAATILGNGNVSMILDVAVLKKLGQQYKKNPSIEKATPILR
jgi:two-component system chemotaxis sensor kinase CheA